MQTQGAAQQAVGPALQSGPLVLTQKILHSYYNKAVNGKPAFLMRNL